MNRLGDPEGFDVESGVEVVGSVGHTVGVVVFTLGVVIFTLGVVTLGFTLGVVLEKGETEEEAEEVEGLLVGPITGGVGLSLK